MAVLAGDAKRYDSFHSQTVFEPDVPMGCLPSLLRWAFQSMALLTEADLTEVCVMAGVDPDAATSQPVIFVIS